MKYEVLFKYMENMPNLKDVIENVGSVDFTEREYVFMKEDNVSVKAIYPRENVISVRLIEPDKESVTLAKTILSVLEISKEDGKKIIESISNNCEENCDCTGTCKRG